MGGGGLEMGAGQEDGKRWRAGKLCTIVKSALYDWHFGINDFGPALQHTSSPQSLHKVFQQLTQQLTLIPASVIITLL